jgi:DNA-directed RNA polymerase subunit RPC12/RpoP
MAIHHACPHCGQQVAAPDDAGGKTVKCPKCASLFVIPAETDPPPLASVSRRDEDYDDRPRRDRRFRCPYCNSREIPRKADEISTGGWVVFAVLLLFCIPLCWIPLITMKEQKRYCYDCGMKLG